MSLYLDILPQLVPQLVLVEGRSPGRLAQVAGDALVHPDPQVLVGRLEITGFSEESPGKTPGVRPATACYSYFVIITESIWRQCAFSIGQQNFALHEYLG